MSDELKRLENALREDETLVEKFEAEYRRISGKRSISMEEPAYLEAAQSLGFNITRTDIDKFMAETQEFNPMEAEYVAGGRDHWCLAAYNCLTAFMHDAPTKEHDACWKDHSCVLLYHGGGGMQKSGCGPDHSNPELYD